MSNHEPPQYPPPNGAPPPPPPPPYVAPTAYPGPPPPPFQGFQASPKRNKALPIILAVVAAVVVLTAAIVVPLVFLGGDEEGPERAGSSAAGGTEGPSTDVDTTNLDLVQVYDALEPTHVSGEISYEQEPPVGGDHNSVWLDCGVYDTQVNAENVVHDLEHGTILITYRPDQIDDAGVEALAAQLPQKGILSPWAEQTAPVVITTWGRQLDLVGVDDPRIGLFVSEFEAGDTAPEPFASCAGGLPDAAGTLE